MAPPTRRLLCLAALAAYSSALQLDAAARYPVLSKLCGRWLGEMRYATGDSLALAPFTLTGAMDISISGTACTIESSVVLPNGQERATRMQADADADDGCLRFSGDGPIDALVTEIAPDTVLLREIERASGRCIMSVSMQLGERPRREVRQVAHELGENAGDVNGVQLWTFTPERIQRASMKRMLGNDE